MSASRRQAALEKIRENIRKSGFHWYLVGGGVSPRFAYTIGLRESLGEEVVLAGAIIYNAKEVRRIIDASARRDLASPSLVVDDLGTFTFRLVDRSWTNLMLLGATDYYKDNEVKALQIVPDAEHWTIDVPDMSVEWDPKRAPVWQWRGTEWSYPVPEKSSASTNLQALRGARVTQAHRWENDYWEMFAEPPSSVTFENCRLVPLGSLVAADASLAPVIDLEIGASLWRDPEGGPWRVWEDGPGADDPVLGN